MKILVLLVVFFICLSSLQAQQKETRETRETKIALVVNHETNAITAIVLFEDMVGQDKESIQKKYPNSAFFVGLLKGGFKVVENGVLPAGNTKLTIFTRKEIFPGEQFFPEKHFYPGDQFNIGKIEAKVISSKKGELIVKTQ